MLNQNANGAGKAKRNGSHRSGGAGTPLYREVEQYLREQIVSGTLGAGDLLPSVKELCDQFGGINHLTVRKAIKNLGEDSLVRSVQGRGTFVTEQAVRDRRVALVLPHLEDTLFIRIAEGAQSVLEAAGVRSLILDSRGSEVIEADHIANLDKLPLSGAIIFPVARGNMAEQVFRLKMSGFPFVLVDRYFDDIATPCVVVDNYQGGYDSARFLIEKGRRRVAWVGEAVSTSAQMRLNGFRDAMNDAEIACPGSRIKNVVAAPADPISYRTARAAGTRAAVEELQRQHPLLDGLVCCDDVTALTALCALQESGCRVPEEISVVGFDDVPEASSSVPSLTTVRQPMDRLGREAATMLLEHMANKSKSPERLVLPVELVERLSA